MLRCRAAIPGVAQENPNRAGWEVGNRRKEKRELLMIRLGKRRRRRQGPNLTSDRMVLKEHPELRRGGWKELPIPVEFRFDPKYRHCRDCRRFMIDREVSVQFYAVDTPWGVVDHLLIRPHSQRPVRDWYTLQRIKTELVGPERVAVEVFPRESQLRDAMVAIYHLWVLPEDFDLPFGMHFPGGGMVRNPGPEDIR